MLEVAANIVHCGSSSQVQRQACGASAMMCCVNSYNEQKLDFTTTRLLPRPCARLLTNEDRILLSSSILLQQVIRLARGGRTCSSGFDTVEAVVVTSLFVFSKRRRAKRNLNVAVANIGARIQPGSCMRQNCYVSPLLYQYVQLLASIAV